MLTLFNWCSMAEQLFFSESYFFFVIVKTQEEDLGKALTTCSRFMKKSEPEKEAKP